LLYYRLASIHNLRFLIRLVEGARAAIIAGAFAEYKARFLAGFTPPDRDAADEQKRRREAKLAGEAC
jgi:queuine tRNA-ribosyltransferase